jgi:AcrR family transcriptional regulator
MTDRPLRADARRNRERLLEAAAAELARKGADASLEEIARKAGVAIGTLYRHFPTREALFVAVHHGEMTRVAGQAGELLARHEPAEALRLWMATFTGFMTAKHGMASAFRMVLAPGRTPSRPCAVPCSTRSPGSCRHAGTRCARTSTSSTSSTASLWRPETPR